MDKEEYKIKLDEIRVKAIRQERLLQREYALSNSAVNKGDIVEDHIGKVLVRSISVSVSIQGTPTCVYHGDELKKDGNPRKIPSQRGAWQGNLITNTK